MPYACVFGKPMITDFTQKQEQFTRKSNFNIITGSKITRYIKNILRYIKKYNI